MCVFGGGGGIFPTKFGAEENFLTSIFLIIVLFVETPRKFFTVKLALSIRKPGSSSVLII